MKRNSGEKFFDTFNIIILAVIALMAFYPFYYVFIYSISDQASIAKGVYLLPEKITFDTYIQIFSKNDIGWAFFISISRTVIGTASTIIFCSMFAYAVSKKELPARRIIYIFITLSMYFSAGIIPWYLTMKALGLKNNFLLYILPLTIIPFYLILLKTYFEQVPAAIEESALVDGAGYFTIFLRIIIPLSLPIIATVAIFTSVLQWNYWVDNLWMNTDPKLQTLQLLLYRYLKDSLAIKVENEADMMRLAKAMSPTSIRMTITVIVVLPICVVYPVMQKYFLKGIMLGAVKG